MNPDEWGFAEHGDVDSQRTGNCIWSIFVELYRDTFKMESFLKLGKLLRIFTLGWKKHKNLNL